jgi:type IX secretion system PorP/SprF family membrane protein
VRSQWNSALGDGYQTFSASGETKLPNKTPNRSGFWALGASFNYDQAGQTELQNTNLNLAASYTQMLGNLSRKKERWAFLTLGVQQGVARRDFIAESVLFDIQYDPETGAGNPGIPNGEPSSLLRNSNTFGDLSAGFNVRIQNFKGCEIVNDYSDRSWIDIGIGVFHLNEPNQSFEEEQEESLPMRFSPYLMWNREIGNSSLDVFGYLNFQFQGAYREFLTHFGGRVYLREVPGREVALELSCGYRFNDQLGDVVYPAVGIQYSNIFAGIAYDLNISEFQVATLYRGGFEMIFRYNLNSVCVDKYFCPLL